jgi:hypothetical protein
MGGFGSGRWDRTITRTSTEGLPRLDVRGLARVGGLACGARAKIIWEGSGSISTEVPENDPSTIMLNFRARTHNGTWINFREQVPLVWTGCAFGGSRVWFACPNCRTRRAILYGLQGRFRCRECHWLAYASTRR